MSGHSKWSNIKHKKEKSDAQKAKIYTKLGREIAVAVKAGGPDPSINGKLKDIIAKARANNMPNDNVKRCIEKATGSQENDNYEDIVYEGYGPRGVAVIVETLTDNRNRTAADVRHYFDKFGGNLGTNGCVSFMFDKYGVLIVEKSDSVSEEELMDAAMEAGAQDFNEEDEVYEILTTPEEFSFVREELENKGFEFLKAEVTLVPQTYVSLTDEKDILMMEKLIEHLEDNDDVQNIYHNWEECEE